MATIQQYFSIGSCSGARWLTEDSFLFLSNRSGVNQVWKKDLTTGEETQLTNFTERIGGVYPKNGSIFFTMDLGGNENEQIHVFREGEEVVNLTNNNAVRHQFGGIKPDGKTISVRTFSPLFALSRLTQHLAWRRAEYDEFDIVIK